MTIVSDLAPWPVEAPAPSFAELSIGFLCLSGLGGSSRVAFGVANAVVAGDGASVVLNGHRRWRLDPRVAHVEIATPEFPKALDSLEVSALGRALAQHVQCHDIRVLAVHYGLGLADVALDAVTRLDRIGIRLPVVVTLHGSEVSHVGCDPAHRLALADVLGHCDRVTAVSNWLADKACSRLGLTERPVVIRNSVNAANFTVKRAARAPSAPITLLHVSNLRDIKRPKDFLAVTRRMIDLDIDVNAVIAGGGPHEADLQSIAREWGVASRVRFLGIVDDRTLAIWFAQSDALLVTSASESFCLAAAEASCAGLPVVGTTSAGLIETLALVEGQAHHCRAAVGDVDALTQGVIHAVARDRVDIAARSRRAAAAAHAFAGEEQIRAYSELFRQVDRRARSA